MVRHHESVGHKIARAIRLEKKLNNTVAQANVSSSQHNPLKQLLHEANRELKHDHRREQQIALIQNRFLRHGLLPTIGQPQLPVATPSVVNSSYSAAHPVTIHIG